MPASHSDRLRLLNPGPVTLTERVRQAQLRPDLCHREPEFTALQDDVRRRLARVYPQAERDYTAVLIGGSGTAAVEAMVDSLVPSWGLALVVANGVYGERIASILGCHRKRYDLVSSRWGAPLDLAEVERRLAACDRYSHVISVHHETTTGRLNDVAALGAICQRRGVPLLLDAVSSFGGEPIDFEAWNLEACAATANKCLHGVPGTAFVVARKSIFERRPSAATTLYLDLFRHRESQEQGSTQFTPAVQSLYALQAALEELDEPGGWTARHAHYRQLSQFIRERLDGAGFSLLLGQENACSSTLTAFNLPPGVKFDDLYQPLKECGFVIYPGQKELQTKIFRVAVMGDLTLADMREFTTALEGLVVRLQSAVGVQPSGCGPVVAVHA